ncbi:hypothetical protein [Magnetospirillum sulfuroxidans]|uniref:Uncharacterized protein n=1 Tax=Magnetospirillum sulfuroxidans TaxID=611300 RepID=A0ABS5IAD9_9PROT|nr:hypothetical protein [Magnetospirillum sulfuroxidans]MBR9971251.1 hypothetical protein [Magnetospirillum sulfuroxidans]
MIRNLVALSVCLVIAAPAWAGEAVRPRLVPGGGSIGLPALAGDNKVAVYSLGGFSLGSIAAPLATAADGVAAIDGMAVGGYAAYSSDWGRVTSSLKSGNGNGVADLTASQHVSPLGLDGLAALSLGYQWTQAAGFSLNPAQMGVSSGALGQASDLSLSLSFTHELTPSFSLGGFAAASRGEDAASLPNSGLHFGAGLELKF